MKRIYSFRTGLEAHDARLFLESQGIEAKVFGDNNALETGFSFTPASAPGLFVHEGDAERAGQLLEQFFDQPKQQPPKGMWSCPNCGESVEEQFDLCWNCETPRGSAPVVSPVERQERETKEDEPDIEDQSIAEPTSSANAVERSRWSLGVEVVVVLAMLEIIGYLLACLNRVVPSWDVELSFVEDSIWKWICLFLVTGATLLVIRWSGDPWSKFGLDKFRPLTDAFVGLAVFIAGLFIHSVGMDVFRAALENFYSPQYVQQLLKGTYKPEYPVGGMEIVIGIITMICVAFSEELIMRGYLIPRFEQLLRSTWCSVLLSAVIFASLHTYQGVGGVWDSFMTGVLFGVVFVYARRIWPLVVTHSLINIVVMLNAD